MESVQKTHEFLVPSGYKVIIREQNGEDDDILSNVSSSQDGSSINNFIQAIVIHSDKVNGKLSRKDVLDLKLRDKYCILFQSRIFSLGAELNFTWDWHNNKPAVEYNEDLSQYIWDYNKDFPIAGDSNYFKYRIQPYPDNSDGRIINLSSGLVVKYDYLNGHGEKYLLELPQTSLSKNAELKARFLKLKTGENDKDWVTVENFKMFSPKDMSEIRNDIKKWDQQFEAISELPNPNNGQITEISLISTPDFFFPGEIS